MCGVRGVGLACGVRRVCAECAACVRVWFLLLLFFCRCRYRQHRCRRCHCCWLIGWLVGWLFGSLAGWLVCQFFVCLFAFLLACSLACFFLSFTAERSPVLGGRMRRPHVVGVGQSKELIKAMLQREELLEMPKVPFAKACGGVALLFADFRKGDFIRIETRVGFGTQSADNSYAIVVAPGQQSCP